MAGGEGREVGDEGGVGGRGSGPGKEGRTGMLLVGARTRTHGLTFGFVWHL